METKRGRGEATREAILQAAEIAFAEAGYSGARIDAIAEASGHNKTLIFRYFGDKLGLYTEVLRRADEEFSTLMARIAAPLLLQNASLTSDARRFKAFLQSTFTAFFDYMVAHPHLARMMNWEQAAGWQTLMSIAAQFEADDLPRLQTVFTKARENGLIRPEVDSAVLIVLAQQLCWSMPNALPLYQPFLFIKNLSANAALEHLRDQVVAMLVVAVMRDPEENSR